MKAASSAADIVPAVLVKEHAEAFLIPYRDIINESFPRSLKEALITPMGKKPSLDSHIMAINRLLFQALHCWPNFQKKMTPYKSRNLLRAVTASTLGNRAFTLDEALKRW